MSTIIHISALGEACLCYVPNLLYEFVRIVSNGVSRFYTLHLHFEVGVGFPTSCPVASRGPPALNMAYFGGITKIGVAALGVGFPMSC
jgi:hypothetical protein